MVHTRPWFAPIVMGVLAAAFVVAAGLYFTHPSGIVIRVGKGEHWQLTRTSVFSGSDEVVMSGTGPLAHDHVTLKPGVYWLVTPTNQINCPIATRYRVRPHQWTTHGSGFAAHSCSIQ